MKKLTEEQVFAVDMATRCTGHMKIEAFAGTGKTTTLAAIAKQMKGKKGQFLAFNRPIADDAKKKLPSSCSANSFHQLAYRRVGYQFKERLGQRINGWVVAKHLGITKGKLKPEDMGSLAMSTVASFCRTLDPVVGVKHVPSYLIEGGTSAKQAGTIAAAAEWAGALWKLMSNPKGKFPTTHDTYLRLYAEQNPVIDADYVLFDEAQDADGLMLHVLLQQKGGNFNLSGLPDPCSGKRLLLNCLDQEKEQNDFFIK